MHISKKGFTLVEVLVTILIIGVILVAVSPSFTNKKFRNGYENNVLKCIKLESASDLNSTACKNALYYAKHRKLGAHTTLFSFADNGSAAEKTAARKVIRQACDDGSEVACKYFLESCKKHLDNCDIASSDNDIDYYLKLLYGSTNTGRLRLKETAGMWYGLGNTNVVTAVDNACCTTGVNTACEINGTDSCGLSTDIYCWGYGADGRLGDNLTGAHSVGLPGIVQGGIKFSSFSSGEIYTCGIEAITNDAYCWGEGEYGCLGDNNTNTHNVGLPNLVVNGHKFSSIEAGMYHTCGIEVGTNDTYCWGWGFYGRLGDGNTSDHRRGYPVLVQGGHKFSSIAVGRGHACGIEEGTNDAYCWGSGNYGKLGDNNTSNHSRGTPYLVQGGYKFSSISAGLYNTCGIEEGTNDAYCWGWGDYGTVGDGSTSGHDVGKPKAVVGGHKFSSISVRSLTACGLEEGTNDAYCWGRGDYGALGDGNTGSHNTGTPKLVQGGLKFSDIYSGIGWTCGSELGTNDAYCWGEGDYGKLGDNNTSAHDVGLPKLVQGGLQFYYVSPSYDHTCGLLK